MSASNDAPAANHPLVLSKFERVNLIATRMEQLLSGAPSTLTCEQARKCSNVEEIAEKEFSLGVFPMGVARKVESHKYKIYDLQAFINPMDQTSMTRSTT